MDYNQTTDLFAGLQPDRESKKTLSLQIYEGLRSMLEKGILLPDTRLPSVRALSGVLGVNQVTIVTAFKRLEAEGLVISKPGSGTYAAGFPIDYTSASMASDHIASAYFPGHSSEISTTGSSSGAVSSFAFSIQDEVFQSEDSGFLQSPTGMDETSVNFASATPTPDLFPVDDFKASLDEALDRDRGNAFSYQENLGFAPLRESIAWLLEKSGLTAAADDIHIISGAQQGIDIISKAMLRQGDFILTESPTYTGAIAAFKSRHAQTADVQINPDGPDMSILEYNIRKYSPRFYYTIPTFHNPTGFSYSNEKRQVLLELADKYDFYIIEDDYVSELDYEGRCYSSLKSMDRSGRVVFIRSFSKIFMPGLRLGFMVVPRRLSESLMAAKHTADISTSGLIQRAFDLYIKNGCWDKHFDFMFNTYKNRYEIMTSAIEASMPSGCSYIRPGGGLNLWISLPYGFPVNSLANHAAGQGIAFAPGRLFYSGNAHQAVNNLRLSFAAVDSAKIKTGIDKLFTLIGRYSDSAAPTVPGKAVNYLPIL
ncbi:MAG: PLP-dependent aminotransferase family protein [Clostridiales bacterium]|nr:PLP-dependent aminotransferase family protein [Clostridiales bacterium]